MDVSSEGGVAGGLTAVSTTSLRISPLAVGKEVLSVGIVLVLGPVEDVLHEAPIGGVVTRSPLIQQRLKNRVASGQAGLCVMRAYPHTGMMYVSER